MDFHCVFPRSFGVNPFVLLALPSTPPLSIFSCNGCRQPDPAKLLILLYILLIILLFSGCIILTASFLPQAFIFNDLAYPLPAGPTASKRGGREGSPQTIDSKGKKPLFTWENP